LAVRAVRRKMLNPLRDARKFSNQLGEAVRATSDSTRQLPALRRVVIDRMESLDRGVRELLELLRTAAADLQRIRGTVESQGERVADIDHAVARVEVRVTEFQNAVTRLEAEVHDARERLPDPETSGPLARAREKLKGGS
jgi:ABC-type transporter Mla subunit MlaD